MDFGLTDIAETVAESTARFSRDILAPGVREREAAHRIPHELLRQVAAQGLMGVNVPASLGGAEAGVLAYAAAVREVAKVDASVAVTTAVTNMVAEVLVEFGTDDQKRRFVPPLVSGDYYAGAFALSEAGSGSDAAGMTTRASKQGRTWVIRGEKLWITSGDDAGVVIVWAKTGPAESREITCFLVEGGKSGMTAGRPEEKMGLCSSHTVALSLDGVEVDDDNRLGEVGQGFAIAMNALDGGRIGISSQALGIAWSAYRTALRYSTERKQFGKPLSGNQAIQFKLADMAVELDAAWLLVLRAAMMKERGKRFTREASMAKVFATEAANRIVREAVQVLGGYGYCEEYDVARAYRDCRATQIYEGTSEIQRIVIAREELKRAATTL